MLQPDTQVFQLTISPLAADVCDAVRPHCVAPDSSIVKTSFGGLLSSRLTVIGTAVSER